MYVYGIENNLHTHTHTHTNAKMQILLLPLGGHVHQVPVH